MPERIYAMSPGGRLEPLEETAFPTEDELQSLIADHPELLDGEQVTPGDPRRWVLVTREKSVAESPGTRGRWSVDHLLVDQDAVPTMVEVKRGENPEIRRTIVGQMLEYAAHAAATWSKDELRRSFEESSRDRGRDPEQAIRDLLGPDEEASTDRFWDEVARNLAANRVRLLFVADKIPEPLKRVTEFLNAQMPGIEVFAIKVKRFRSGQSQALVPRVFGPTALSRAVGRASQLTRELFLDDFRVQVQREAATQLLNAYMGLPNHQAVNHGVGEYVDGMAHTNGIESFWAMLKRGYHGTYHQMSAKHLDRYVTEFAGRHNDREWDTADQMRFIAKRMVGKRLRYKDLAA